MRKATMKNIEQIGDLDLLDEDQVLNLPKIDKEYKIKIRQDLSIALGESQIYLNQDEDLEINQNNLIADKDADNEYKSKLRQDLTLIFGNNENDH